jgi:hypothetical protein
VGCTSRRSGPFQSRRPRARCLVSAAGMMT